MNLTISVDDKLLSSARALARKRGISLQDLLRGYLESLVGAQTSDQVADDLSELMRDSGGRSGGRRVSRDDAYTGRA
jgi:hypothetical protein